MIFRTLSFSNSPTPYPMLWRIRHPFQSLIDAPTKGDAFRQMVARIMNDPESFITDVQPATPPAGKPLWKRLLTGK